MTNTEIIYNALKKAGHELAKIEVEEVDTECMMCSKSITEGVRRNRAVSSNFTDYDTFKNIKGTHICEECTNCLKSTDLRYNNFVADKNNIHLFKKQDLENYLFDLDKFVSSEFVVGITRSYKKHNSFRCSINYNTKRFYIREEDKEYLFDVELGKTLYEKLWAMYLYFTKDEILAGNYSINRIQEFGIDKFGVYEGIISEHRGTHYLDLLVFMLDSEKRNEIVNERIKIQKAEREKIKKEEKARIKAEKELQKNKQLTLL